MSMYEELWRACAGPFIHLPRTGERAFYFPQGHLEQAAALRNENSNEMLPIFDFPSKILCRVVNINPRADEETDEVYAQITLLPELNQDDVDEMDPLLGEPSRPIVKSFYKKLTITDIRNKLHVRQHDANNYFPPLDMTQKTPSQELVAKDIHGFSWHFKHAFTGNPKRHVLTTGWKRFAIEKRLVAGDSIIFIRGEKGELHIGIRRVSSQRKYTPYYYLASGKNKDLSTDVAYPTWQSASLGILATACHAIHTGTLFTVCYKPSCGISQFIVGKNKYTGSAKKLYSIGTRFSMRFEDDNHEETRCNGSIVEVGDISRYWADSKWRCLKVKWDNLGATMRPQRVSPWEIDPPELNMQQHGTNIIDMPNIHDIDPLILSQQCWIQDEGQPNWTLLHQMCAQPSEPLLSDEDSWLQNMLNDIELPNEDGSIQFQEGSMNMIVCNQFHTVSPPIHFSELNGERVLSVNSEESVQGVETTKRKAISVEDDRRVKCRIEASDCCGVDSNSNETRYSSASEGECGQDLTPVQVPEKGFVYRVWDRIFRPLIHQLKNYAAK